MTRRWSLAGALALALLALSSVSVHCGRTLRITDMNGAPVEGVFIIYHHEGSRPNLAHPTTYQASALSVAQSPSGGLMEIPPSVDVHWPFPIETHPRLRVDLVYAPTLHNGLATIVESAVAKPGAFQVGEDLASVRLADLTDTPVLWEGTLQNLSSIVSRLMASDSKPPRRRATPETEDLTRVLAGQFVQDYRAFLDKHGNSARPKPPMPAGLTPDDVRAWNEMVDRNLAQEPLWGDSAKRMFGREAERFDRFVAGSR